MSNIYHYTDLNGFLNILKNRTLWLTNTNSMNDHQEIHWFKNLLRKRLDEAELNEGLNPEQIKILGQFWSSLINPISNPHICCFSQCGDLLSQWRAYADDAQGISIGFSKDKLNLSKRFPVTTVSIHREDNVYIQDVIYDEKAQNEIINSVVDRVIKRLKISSDFHQEISMLINECFGYSYIFKNPAFSEESEARIINLGFLDNSNKWFGTVGKVNFRVSGDTLASYFNLSFDAGAVEEVIIGPKSKVNLDDIELFLRSNGLEHVKVNRSTASYR